MWIANELISIYICKIDIMNKKSAFFNKKTPSDSEITDKLVATVNDARIVAAYREIYKETGNRIS